MTCSEAITYIQEFLETDFLIENDFLIGSYKVPIKASRIAGLKGTDYVFIFDSKAFLNDMTLMQKVHEVMRAYVNSLYKVPKLMRLKVPNILTVFVSDIGFDQNTIEWANSMKRNYMGGEIYGVGLIDLVSMGFYHQGIHRTKVSSSSAYLDVTFNNIDPQNRSYAILTALTNHLKNV